MILKQGKMIQVSQKNDIEVNNNDMKLTQKDMKEF